ncbi:hypothetical protein [Glycomyces rhizosphaerae]|uniref:ScoMcrA-like SRA domain-containing protein n=1 Tax=Glycomyces rhizosphaerae TaxID=2054422 RepID=A0ABV7Q2F3_9ACTN
MAEVPEFELGRTYDRDEIVENWGGSRYSGIAHSRKTPNVMIFSDPPKGRTYGYIDHLALYDGEGPLVRYTGEGRVDDQKMTPGNAAILNHHEDGRSLRLFEAVGYVGKSAARLHRYLGEYQVDLPTTHIISEAPDENGKLRKVIVFQLRPVGPTAEPSVDSMPVVPGISYTDFHSVTEVEPVEVITSKLVELENNAASAIVRKAVEETEVRRREAELVDRFRAYLEGEGHEVKRCQIPIPGLNAVLLSDVFDVADKILYEAKGQADRNSIRLAIGQLFDYQRHIDPQPAALAILLPEAPNEDLKSLIASVGIELVFEEDGQFVGWPVSAASMRTNASTDSNR